VLVLTVDADAGASSDFDPFNPANIASSAFPGITPFKPKVDQQEPLRSELLSFLTAVRHRTTPEVSLEQGRSALAVALQIVDAIGQHARRAHLEALTGSVS
jgi:hypothetical protein